MPAQPQIIYQNSSLSFTQGLLLGQISICILLGLLIKFFIFGEASSLPSRQTQQRRRRRATFSSTASLSASHSSQHAQIHAHAPSALRPTPPQTTAEILAKTYYNVNHHQAESVDWFNVLLAQTIAQLRTDAQADGAVLSSLTHVLNSERKPDWLAGVRVTEVNLGDEFPIFSNCRVIPVPTSSSVDYTNESVGDNSERPDSSGGSGDGSRLQARLDVDLSDALTLGIETQLVLNYPRPRTAVMPVALAVSVVRFSGTLSISFIPSPGTPNPSSSDPTPPTTLTFSFLPDYRLELSTHSLLGSRARLQDVPKIAQIIEARICDWFDERCVAPRFQQVVLPSLWPRARNTRTGAAPGEDDGSGEAIGSSNGTPMGSVRRRGTGTRPSVSGSGVGEAFGGISMKDIELIKEERRVQELKMRKSRQQRPEINADEAAIGDGDVGAAWTSSRAVHSQQNSKDGRFQVPGSMP